MTIDPMTAIPPFPQLPPGAPKPPKPPKPTGASAPAPAAPAGDDLLPDVGRGYSSRADCCVARAAYRIVFRTRAEHARSTELFLCGHHYRASTTALLEVQATAYDQRHRLLASFS